MAFCNAFSAAVPAPAEPAGRLVSCISALPTDFTIGVFCMMSLRILLIRDTAVRLTLTSVE